MIRTLMMIAALVLPAAAQAQRQQYKAKDPIVLQPDTAYVLFRSPDPLPYVFIRTPNEGDIAAYRGARDAAMAKARAKYERARKAYPKQVETWQADQRSGLTRARPVEPVAPTDASLAMPPIEMGLMASTLAGRRVTAKTDGNYYLISVAPGTYSFYGVIEVANGFVGTCLCMGTVNFEARPGVITNLGTISLAGVTQPGTADALPARFSGLTIQPAEFHAGEKFPNFFGVLIDRLPEMPGVMRYQRDRIIDVRKEAAGPAAK